VVTPKLAMARRTHTTSYTSPQKPEIMKNAKYQCSLGIPSARFCDSPVSASNTVRMHFLSIAGKFHQSGATRLAYIIY